MSELQEKVNMSIERLKAFEPEEGYNLAFSGGKDSVVCKALLDMAGCKYDATYRVTSVDPPELVQFIKTYHPDVIREVPRYSDSDKNEALRGKPITMWNLIAKKKKYPPTRMSRFCCEYLKESCGDGRLQVTGVRWAESYNRREGQGLVTLFGRSAPKQFKENENFRTTSHGSVVLVNDNAESRRMIESCYKRRKTSVNPIIDWEDRDVWDFVKAHKIPYCSLYDEGFQRLGCIGCPLAGRSAREKEFIRYPKYKNAYLMAFEKMLEIRKEIHDKDPSKPIWNKNHVGYIDAKGVFNWWMEYDILPGQTNLFDGGEEEDEEDG